MSARGLQGEWNKLWKLLFRVVLLFAGIGIVENRMEAVDVFLSRVKGVWVFLA